MKKNSVKKNYIFNMVYQVFCLIVPLVTTPYISKIFLAEGIGKYSYTYSLANYFVLVAALGFATYGQREIANHQNNKEKQSVSFWEIIIVRLFSTMICLIVFIIMCLLNVFDSYTVLMWWWILLIIAQVFDITFLFQGNEDFGKIVIRNMLIRIVSIVFIFCFIKKQNDVWMYVCCISLSNLLGNLSLWLNIKKNICLIPLNKLHPCRHIVPTLKLFIPTIAVSIYTVLDKTLLGLLINDVYTINEEQIVDGTKKMVEVTKKIADLENGYYEQAEKIVKLPLGVITSLSNVMISRNSNEISNGNITQFKKNVYTAGRFALFLGIPLTFGLIAIAPILIPWFLGPGFEKSILLMRLFSFLVLIIGICNVLGVQYLIPLKKDVKYTIGILAGAGVNLVLNLILIPLFWSIGAVIASIIAEFIVCFSMYMFARKEISISKIFTSSIKYWFSGLIMFIFIYITQLYLEPSIKSTIIIIFEGIILYFSCLFLFRDDFFMNLLNSFMKKILNLRNTILKKK
ncbi:MAG TPA: oligosaccharide flippase family protein [Bacilli bacterium]|nr:oligosaccharide flippase family protein [Bacilli bacterium]